MAKGKEVLSMRDTLDLADDFDDPGNDDDDDDFDSSSGDGDEDW
jgi:hypothetical protein